MTVEVRGAEQLARLSRRLKEAGKGLDREMSQALSRATDPLKAAARESARTVLPRHGGLNEKVANSKFTTRRVSSSRGTGVRVQARNAYALAQLDKGRARHPVFGNRQAWVSQPVTPGWWTKPVEAVSSKVLVEIQRAMDDVARKIEHRP